MLLKSTNYFCKDIKTVVVFFRLCNTLVCVLSFLEGFLTNKSQFFCPILLIESNIFKRMPQKDANFIKNVKNIMSTKHTSCLWPIS